MSDFALVVLRRSADPAFPDIQLYRGQMMTIREPDAAAAHDAVTERWSADPRRGAGGAPLSSQRHNEKAPLVAAV
jgi:hypothetical protein